MLWISYEELKKDLKGEIKRIAEYAGRRLPPSPFHTHTMGRDSPVLWTGPPLAMPLQASKHASKCALKRNETTHVNATLWLVFVIHEMHRFCGIAASEEVLDATTAAVNPHPPTHTPTQKKRSFC